MKKRIITGIQILSILFAAGCSGKNQVPDKQLPNIVLIFADDMGYGDLGCFGATSYQTPHIDKLAGQGMRFTNFYAAHAICSASRASLLTGSYSNRLGILGALNPFDETGLNPEEETIPEALKKSGYKSGIFGKWHLGHHKAFLPLQQGFDEYVGLPYSNDMWPYHYDGARIDPKKDPNKRISPPLPLIEGNKKIKEINSLDDQAQLTGIYTKHAVEFIKKNRNSPFFLYLPYSMPHVPIAASEEFKGKSKAGVYGDVIMEIDWSVGQIVKTLEENGLSDNTLVIFTSDNGPWLKFGNHAGSSGGLREGKLTSWEGGQRAPCVMKWPGHIPEGAVCNRLASALDILPTLASITNSPLPEKKIDGLDISDLLTGVAGANPREVFYYYHKTNLEAIRYGRWKLVFPHSYTTYEKFPQGMNGLPGKTGRNETSTALYDMRSDPGERYDILDLHLEVVDKLNRLADNIRYELGDRLTQTVGSGIRKPGKVFHKENKNK